MSRAPRIMEAELLLPQTPSTTTNTITTITIMHHSNTITSITTNSTTPILWHKAPPLQAR